MVGLKLWLSGEAGERVIMSDSIRLAFFPLLFLYLSPFADLFIGRGNVSVRVADGEGRSGNEAF